VAATKAGSVVEGPIAEGAVDAGVSSAIARRTAAGVAWRIEFRLPMYIVARAAMIRMTPMAVFFLSTKRVSKTG
jgi:hypothetical protein